MDKLRARYLLDKWMETANVMPVKDEVIYRETHPNKQSD